MDDGRPTLLAEVVAASEEVAATSARNAKRDRLADLLARLAPDEVPVTVALLTGVPRQGRFGVGWRTLRAAEAPRKNLVPVAGRPLLWWSVRHGLDAGAVDRVVVSTDDEEIAACARDAGAEVPFLRPAALAGDDVTDLPVFQHALRWLDEHDGWQPEVVVHLRPTSPVRPAGLVDDVVGRLRATPTATSVRSVTPLAHPPHKLWWTDDDGWLQPVCGTLEEERFNLPRQALPVGWRHDGVIDAVRSEVLVAGSMTGTRVLAHRSPEGTGVDIDVPDDLAAAEAALIRHLDAPR